MNTIRRKTIFIAQAGIIAALYVVLTMLSDAFGLAGTNLVQFRLSEILVILPFFTPAAIPGLFIGCLIANLIKSAHPLELFGAFATLAAALWTYAFTIAPLTKPIAKWLAPWPAVIFNAAIMPFVIRNAYGVQGSIPLLAGAVALGQIAMCVVGGYILLFALEKRKNAIFGQL
ncbi:MAG: QueT transporter family protein [Oscillospiraceae bacterium]|nr:QueT transporter family protein [Oscillospiraceae bacterium]